MGGEKRHKCRGLWSGQRKALVPTQKICCYIQQLVQLLSTGCLKFHYDCFFKQVKQSQSPDLNPIAHYQDVMDQKICFMNAESTSLQQLPNAIMQLSTKPFALFFWERRKVLPGTKNVYIIKQLFSVHTLSGKYQEDFDSSRVTDSSKAIILLQLRRCFLLELHTKAFSTTHCYCLMLILFLFPST